MKERVQEIKEAREKGERVYRKGITVGVMKEAGMMPFDLVDIGKVNSKFKDTPIDFSWDKCINLHNALLLSGPNINDDTPYIEALEAIGNMFEAGFLLSTSKKS